MSELYVPTTHHEQGYRTAYAEELSEQKWREVRDEVRSCQITIGSELNPTVVARALFDTLGAVAVTFEPESDCFDVTGPRSGFVDRLIDDVVDMACDNKPLLAISNYVDEAIDMQVDCEYDDEREYR